MTASSHHGWLYRRAVLPFLALLRLGTTPECLAWSIAAGLVIGINPLLGSTTLVCLAIASVFRLNIAASQLANHIVYPLEVLLVIPFIRAGSRLFHTAPLPLSPASLSTKPAPVPWRSPVNSGSGSPTPSLSGHVPQSSSRPSSLLRSPPSCASF